MSSASTRLLDYAEAVLFDLDGTLLDTARDLVNALHIVCGEEQQPAPDAALAAQYVSTGAIGLVRNGDKIRIERTWDGFTAPENR